MAIDMMNLRDLVKTAPDADLLRETGDLCGRRFAAERPMQPEVGAAKGVAHGEKDPARRAQHNGHRDRDWGTRAGTVEWRVPKLRKGSCFQSFPEPRRIAEREPANTAGPRERAKPDGGDPRGLCSRHPDAVPGWFGQGHGHFQAPGPAPVQKDQRQGEGFPQPPTRRVDPQGNAPPGRFPTVRGQSAQSTAPSCGPTPPAPRSGAAGGSCPSPSSSPSGRTPTAGVKSWVWGRAPARPGRSGPSSCAR